MNVLKVDKRLLLPVLTGFFIMGFCDIVAPISGRIATEFPDSSQSAVNFLPTMVFLWFLLLSTPFAALMNRIGRKATALIGYTFTILGLMVPYAAGVDCALVWYFIGFGLLGIGNTAIQVAINPLLATIVPGERMTSYLTVGQIFRNMSLLLLAPIVTLLVVAVGSWRLLLPLYAILTLAGGVWLQLTTVHEPARRVGSVGMAACFALLRNPTVALCAFGVAAFIASDVGIGFLSSRLLDNPDSILTSTGFYACRIVGTLVGAWILVRISDVKYLRWNMCGAFLLAFVLLFVRSDAAVYALVGLLGFAMACVFATFYAVATKSVPTQANEVAGLMIMMISAGAISGPAIGAIVRATGVVHYGLLFVLVCLSYLVWASFKLKTKCKNSEQNA
ncbi:MAG: MFS transporter [Alistipes sp.]